MPILSGAIPAFEGFMTKWEALCEQFPKLRFWIDIGLKWATKYYKRMDDTDAYIVTMSRSRYSTLSRLTAHIIAPS